MVQKALNAVCDAFQGCDTLAYADLSTKLVLATNDASQQTRDALNELGSEAAIILSEGNIGVVGTSEGFRLFLRDPDEPTEALICLCALDTDVEALVPEAQKCLAELAAGSEAS